MTDTAFGRTADFSVGVEEEIMLLDAETLAPAAASDALIAESEGAGLPGRLKTELFASVVELTTNECETAADAVEALRGLRTGASELAGRLGLRLAAAGTHPLARPDAQEIASDERYRQFVAYAGISARRQGVNGLHVHVGMPSARACFHALEGVLPWLPLVLALSANSPYLAGEETGLASNRAEILAQLPRAGAPPPFGGYDDWERFVQRFVDAGLADDYTRFWWDVRPHPRFGTLEVRMPDQPTTLERTAAFAALVQALAATALEESPREPTADGRGVYQQNRWAALRFGCAGELLHPDEDRAVPVEELAGELLERIRPAARKLGAEEFLRTFEPVSCEADRQLEIGRRDGLRAVCEDVVERTLGSA